MRVSKSLERYITCNAWRHFVENSPSSQRNTIRSRQRNVNLQRQTEKEVALFTASASDENQQSQTGGRLEESMKFQSVVRRTSVTFWSDVVEVSTIVRRAPWANIGYEEPSLITESGSCDTFITLSSQALLKKIGQGRCWQNVEWQCFRGGYSNMLVSNRFCSHKRWQLLVSRWLPHIESGKGDR